MLAPLRLICCTEARVGSTSMHALHDEPTPAYKTDPETATLVVT